MARGEDEQRDLWPSMKVPPKRKGNQRKCSRGGMRTPTLNESPSEKEGKFPLRNHAPPINSAPSMKVPPKRKGNSEGWVPNPVWPHTLNESPSEKEGKSPAAVQSMLMMQALNESPSEKEGK